MIRELQVETTVKSTLDKKVSLPDASEGGELNCKESSCNELSDNRRAFHRRVLRIAGSGISGLCLGSTSLAILNSLADDCDADDLPPRTDFDELYTADVDRAVRSGLRLLMRNQSEDGSFANTSGGRNVGVCSLAGLAFLSRGVRTGIGPAGVTLQKICKYVLASSRESGLLTVPDATSHGPMYEHGFGTLFLAELHGTDPSLDVRSHLVSAVDLIVRSQNNQGGWRYDPRPTDADLSVTVCQVMALRAARNAGVGVAKETIDRAVDYIRRSQNPDGGFMYQRSGGASRFPLTAAAVVALYNAGIYDSTEIDSAIKYLQDNFAACSSLAHETFFYYAHYYSAQAFWHRGGDQWKQWYLRLRRILLQLRTEDRGWVDFYSSEYGTAMACLILNMPRSVLPIFQR